MINRIIKNFRHRNAFKVFRGLKKQRSFTDIERQEYQVEKLKSILKIAKDIPYYRTYLNRLNIDDLQYQEFVKIPFLSKETIRERSDELLNRNFLKLTETYPNTSGGSTGEPIKLMQTKEQSYYGLGNYYYANYLNGIKPEDSMVVLWGALRDMHNVESTSFFKKIRDYLTNSLTLNTYILNPEIIELYVNKINKYKPKVIKAYVHSLYDIAKYINEKEIKINCKPIIHTSTGPLYPEIKKEIKKAFNDAHVFSFYGSREVSAIATEVPEKNGMIVLYDNVFVEVINKKGEPAKEGEEGEIVVTTLNNKYMPLIRYKIGDRAIKGDNDSTYGTLILESVLGRTLGVIYTKDGRSIDGQFFTSLFFGKSGIKNFQLIQLNISHVVLRIVKRAAFNQQELDEILCRIKEELEGVYVGVEFCDKIELTETGKVMYVYSKIGK